MERNPNKFPPHVTLNLQGGRQLKCHKQNTSIYEFEEENEQEHIFVDTSVDRHNPKAIYLHRFEFEIAHPNDPELYKKICKKMGKVGIETVIEERPSEADRKVYEDKLARYGLTKSGLAVPERFADPEAKQLTPRQESKIAYLAYILEHGHMPPEEFDGSGDLFI